MHVLFIAAGWVDLMRLLPFVIAFLVWVIGRFATNLPQKPPQRATRLPKPAAPQTPQQQGDPLQSEINEFLQQARAAQEGRASSKTGKVAATSEQSREKMPASSGRAGDAPRKRTPRRSATTQSDTGSRREEGRTISRPPLPPVTAELSRSPLDPLSPRESVAQHVAESLDSSKFGKRATQLGQVQESTDSEFRQHMQRVFQHNLGSLKKEATGIFEAAGAAASAASADVSAKGNRRGRRCAIRHGPCCHA